MKAWLFAIFYSEALFCALKLPPLAIFCGLAFALLCALLHLTAFRNDHVWELQTQSLGNQDAEKKMKRKKKNIQIALQNILPKPQNRKVPTHGFAKRFVSAKLF